MARPQRHNVDYFPHYISDGKKMFIIESKFGNDGYAAWFKILETLAKTDDHWIDLNDEANLMYLAAKCSVEDSFLIELIDAVVKLGEIDARLWNEQKVIWCQKFIDSIDDAYRKRGNDCMDKDGLIAVLRGLGRNIEGLGSSEGGVKPQSKVDYNKLNNIKPKETRDYESPQSSTPTLKDVKDKIGSVLMSRGISKQDFPVDALCERFHDNYEAKGWQINGQKITKWSAKLNQWVSEHLKDPSRLLGKDHGKVTAEEKEEINISLLKHLRDVQSNDNDTSITEHNRVRGISEK